MQQKNLMTPSKMAVFIFSLDDELLKEILYILVTIFGEILVGDD